LSVWTVGEDGQWARSLDTLYFVWEREFEWKRYLAESSISYELLEDHVLGKFLIFSNKKEKKP